MRDVIETGPGFWNIRGAFKLNGLLPIGTHASLARLTDGRFVLLDAYTLPDPALELVRGLTDGGRDVDAILNLHPFHTVHVERAHQQFPGARLFGSERHVRQASGLTWQDVRVDDPAMNELFPGLEFSVPAGVDFISADPKIHFSSVLAYHPASKTLHVDDTFNYVDLPLVRGLSFHPTLSRALEPRSGAAADFRAWAGELAARWGEVEHVCAAHNAALSGIDDFSDRVRRALSRVERTLAAHERRQA